MTVVPTVEQAPAERGATTVEAASVAASARRRRSRRTVGGRLGAHALGGLSAVLRRLPEGPLVGGADLIGGILYRTQPARRRLVRANLERVVTYLAEHDMAGERARAASADGKKLDSLVRDAFGHYVRGYLEGATLPRYASVASLARVQPDEPALADIAFGKPGALIIVSLHFGALEIPGLWATKTLGRRITAPMETISDPDLQAYFERTRRQTGLNVIPVKSSAAKLRATLARGDTVGLVADRPVGGAGTSVELFGAPARLPLGPAALALESGAPVWLVATRRAENGKYRARLEKIDVVTTGSRREQLSAFMAAEARAFERAVADAPEQWWTVFFPIWDDIRP